MRPAKVIRLSLGVLALVAAATLKLTLAQNQVQKQRVPISAGLYLEVSEDWTSSRMPPPPPPQLAQYAPRVTFQELMYLENPKTYSVLRIGATTNPFLGQDEVALDTQMHSPAGSGNSLIDYLFYFFFPPPRECLDEGVTAFQKAKTANVMQSRPSDTIRMQTDCQYSPTVSDFYSNQLSSGMEFERTNNKENAGGIYGGFYLSAMEKLEVNGLTFYVFEAQAQTQLTLDTVNFFNLPNDLQGAQTDYFWAIGAPTPFPFSLDPLRKNTQVIQFAYAGVGLGGSKRENVMKLLKQMHSSVQGGTSMLSRSQLSGT